MCGGAGHDVFGGTPVDDGMPDRLWGGAGDDVLNETATAGDGTVTVSRYYPRDRNCRATRGRGE